MKTLSIILFAALLSSCGKVWHLRNKPTTDEERKAVAAHVEKILAATPHHLSGDDQDWDDAIEMANRQACETFCRPTMWEYDIGPQNYTGRWKYAEQVGPEKQ